jgi:hypothetical protein
MESRPFVVRFGSRRLRPSGSQLFGCSRGVAVACLLDSSFLEGVRAFFSLRARLDAGLWGGGGGVGVGGIMMMGWDG